MTFQLLVMDMIFKLMLANTTGAGETVGAFVGLTFLTAFYFLPTVVAFTRDHKNKVPIFLVNFLTGWLGIGWVIAIVWSFTREE